MATDPHAGESVTGLPQLAFPTFPNQIFWLVIALVAIFLILSRVALPRIAAVLAERQGTITNDIAAAEELKLKAEEAEAAYNKALAEAQKIAAEARAEIQAELDVAMAKADAEISARAAESEKRIGDIQEGALSAVRQVAEETAGELVTALGGSSDAGAVTGAVDARMKG